MGAVVCVGGGGGVLGGRWRSESLEFWCGATGTRSYLSLTETKKKKAKNVRLDFWCWPEWSRALWKSGTRETRRWACNALWAWQDRILNGETEQCATAFRS